MPQLPDGTVIPQCEAKYTDPVSGQIRHCVIPEDVTHDVHRDARAVEWKDGTITSNQEIV